MNKFKLAALATLLAFGAAQADEVEVEKKVEMKVIVAGDGHDIDWTSSGMNFDMNDLAVGESRTVAGDSGREVTFTRTADGLQLEVEGETVMLPEIGAHGTHMAFVDGGDIDVEVMAMDGAHEDVRVVGTHAIRAHPPEGVTIISATALDDSVKDSIRSVLISAGHNDEVRFVDGSGENEHVRIIKRKVEVTE